MTYSESLRSLKSAQKAARGPAYTRFVNRPVGRVIAAAAAEMRLTPNQVSGISFAFSCGGFALAALVTPNWLSAVGVALLLAIGFALDSADGQVARLRDMSSHRGEWVDHMLDCAKISILHLSILTVFYRYFEFRGAWLLLPMLALVVDNLIFFGGILTDQLKRAQAMTSSGSLPQAGRTSPVKSLLMLPVDYGVIVWSFVLLPLPAVFSAVYAILTFAKVLFLGAYVRTWYHELD